MKNFLSGLFFLIGLNISATTYYVNPLTGKDANSGTSQKCPFQHLDRLRTIDLQAGDSILLSTEGVHQGIIHLNEVNGTGEQPIVISAYDTQNGNRKLATINAAGRTAAVLLDNCSNFRISRLQVTADGGEIDAQTQEAHMRCGILIRATKPGNYGNFYLEQLQISDVFYFPKGFKRDITEVRSPNGTMPYGFGIRVINKCKQALLRNINIRQCHIDNVGHTGIKFSGTEHNIQDFHIAHNIISHTGGPGMQASCVKNGHIFQNHISYSGSNDDSRKWGRGSGLWTWGADSIMIERNYFMYANGPADSAGAHIDFNCSNVIIQYNLSAYNAGGFCEILGNNHNCAYRYNISVNDGFRTKGVGGAFQEGKTLWTSGFVGKNKRRFGPCHNYIYNNTIYVDNKHSAKIAFENTTKGLLVANNIFYIAGPCKRVPGDQYQPETSNGHHAENILIKNNLFLTTDTWNKRIPHPNIQPLTGNPHFVNDGGLALEDYIPQNRELIQDKGIRIIPLQNAPQELMGGMQPSVDILGNPITGLPDMGAIEIR